MRFLHKKDILTLLLGFILTACGDNSEDFSPGKINDTALSFTSASKVSVYENQLDLIDVNIEQSNLSVIYSLSGQDSPLFNIEGSSGIITFKTAPDYETKKSYELIVSVVDSDKNKITQTLIISILDIDETLADITSPVFISNAAISVKENQTTALILKAKDSESSLTYSIFGQDASNFNVNKTSGLVVFKEAPDFETKGSYYFTAKATDSAGNAVEQAISISILDVDEFIPDLTAPTFSSTNEASVYENQTSVLTLVAKDETSAVVYSIFSEDADSFIVNEKNGLISFKTAPDFEIKSLYTFRAKVTDASGNFSTQNIKIIVLDIVDETLDRSVIQTIDLVSLAKKEGLSILDYLVKEFEKEQPSNFTTYDSQVFSQYNKTTTATFNTDNWAGSYDLTGLAFDSILGAALITNQHLIGVAHYSRGVGSEVVFFTKEGRRVLRTVVALKKLKEYDARLRDGIILKLDSPVPEDIKVYPILNSTGLGDFSDLLTAPLMTSDKQRKVFVAQIQNFDASSQMVQYGKNDRVDNLMFHDSVGGDSGSPNFMMIQGQLVLSSAHTGHAGILMQGHFFGFSSMQDALNQAIKDMKNNK